MQERRDTEPAVSGFDFPADGSKIHYGGQAVIEGVMMRGPTAIATAVRLPGGRIAVHREPFVSASRRNKLLRLPVVRGGLTLIESLALGIKALNYSASVVMEEVERKEQSAAPAEGAAPAAAMDGADASGTTPALAEEPAAAEHPALADEPATADRADKKSRAGKAREWSTSAALTGTMIVAFAIGILVFFWIPMVLSGLFTDYLGSDSGILFNVVDGIIRVVFFLLYIWGISKWKEMRRVFEYHGAEHKIIFTHEAGQELTIENARTHGTRHPRCGTSFLLIVMVVSILVFMVFGKPPTVGLRLARLLLIPVIAGISYEVMKLSAKKSDRPWARIVAAPGVWLQGITTKEPSDDQIEVAIAALSAVRVDAGAGAAVGASAGVGADTGDGREAEVDQG
jgi:uncharacterized protein YqhQ